MSDTDRPAVPKLLTPAAVAPKKPTPPAVAPKLFPPATVAALLGIKEQSLRVKRMRGGGPPFVRIGGSLTGRVLYPAADFEAWLASRPRFTSTHAEKVAAKAKGTGAA